MNEVEKRIKHQIDNNTGQVDLKIDLVKYMQQSERAKQYEESVKEKG